MTHGGFYLPGYPFVATHVRALRRGERQALECMLLAEDADTCLYRVQYGKGTDRVICTSAGYFETNFKVL